MRLQALAMRLRACMSGAVPGGGTTRPDGEASLMPGGESTVPFSGDDGLVLLSALAG